jgi:hypothetical protein
MLELLESLEWRVAPAPQVQLDEQVQLETLEILEQMLPQELLEILDRQGIQETLEIQVLLEVRPVQVPQGIQGIPVVRDLRETLDLQGPEDLQELLDGQTLHLELQDRQAIQDPLELRVLGVRQDVHPLYRV